MLQAAQERLLQSAHDCSEGGFSVCLAESCIADKEKLLGAQVDYACGLRADRILFSESQSRVVVSVRAENLERVKAVASQHHVPLAEIGRVGGDKLRINDTIDVDVYAMCEAYYEALRRCMEG
ncbi:MAG: hypothetical protein A2293_05460 [Elusimicrobia bacterium RIFOXYB2_FULL_49_7]|nr:MAG: hypothetical protein A2293_05460 [Elusimicrobia bacterium RIFOXYB2_FULL_49_7]